ncbi:MAG TPA: polysaccharide deacetylase family protein [Acidobacteriaceae bacterium]|jgi:peptidoglycan/xylan/chitin deacetylase (PgdA/CDA1 family)
MQALGITRLIEFAGSKPGILVINHHRIGNPGSSRFDRGVFSATVEQLDRQIAYLKRRFPIVAGEELLALGTSGKPLKRMHVAVTFDDGYLDNYTNTFDVLRHHGCAATFFLVPTYVGTNTVPWWDAIAYLVRNSPHSALTLDIPVPLTVPLEGDRERAILAVLRHYKRADNIRQDEFLNHLQAAAGCEIPHPGRRFLDWNEANEMQAAGMVIGSHTFSHRILSQLSEEQQRQELTQSRSILEQHMQRPVLTLAYPVGSTTAFTPSTERLSADAGYKLCFSFYGGVNIPDRFRPTNLLRNSFEPDELVFRNQISWMTSLGRLPY